MLTDLLVGLTETDDYRLKILYLHVLLVLLNCVRFAKTYSELLMDNSNMLMSHDVEILFYLSLLPRILSLGKDKIPNVRFSCVLALEKTFFGKSCSTDLTTNVD